MVSKLFEKAPVKYPLVRSLSVLDPRVLLSHSDLRVRVVFRKADRTKCCLTLKIAKKVAKQSPFDDEGEMVYCSKYSSWKCHRKISSTY